MNLNNKILLLRFSDNHGVDTVSAHKEVIDSDGYCWWAKIGKQPSQKYLDEFFDQNNPEILLYKPGCLFLAQCGGITIGRPKEAYPEYYDRDIFNKDEEPQLYFKLISIEPIEMDFLQNYIVRSSEKEVLYDLKKTISSYMFVQHKDAPRKPPRPKRVKKEKKKEVIDKRGCVYRLKNGKCNNKRSVNYLYECFRPETCIRQKVK